jgi:hypothetical protein
VVVKTTSEDDLITDLAETFSNLRHNRWKLNPEKCIFGVASDNLQGFMVSHRGVEANPTKVDTIGKKKRPTGKKDVMKLTGMMSALGRFISKLGEKGLPFFKLLKKSDKFEWTNKEDQALKELKTFLTTALIFVPRRLKRPCYSTSSRPLRWSTRSWWLNDFKKVTLTPSNDLSTTSVRSYLTARLGNRNPRKRCTLSSLHRASCGITCSRTRSRSSPASP